jgi:hypothetical protein
MSDDYYYDYDPNLNLVHYDDVFYGNFPTEKELYNMVVKKEENNKSHQKPKDNKRTKKTYKRPNTTKEIYQDSYSTSWVCIVLVCIILFTIVRYGLIGHALENNRTLTSLALLTPEISNAAYLVAL